MRALGFLSPQSEAENPDLFAMTTDMLIAPSTPPWSKPQTSPSPNFQLCQFILDARGVVLSHDSDAHDKIGFRETELTGLRFNDILFEINPRWTEFLTEDIPPNTLFLPWEDASHQHAYGIELKSISLGGQTYITLIPTLAPQEILKNASVLEIPQNRESFTQLFMRLQAAESRLNTYMHHFPGIFFSQRPDLSLSHIGPHFENLLSIDATRFMRSGSEYLKLILEKDREAFLSKLEEHSLSSKTFTINYRLKNPKEETILYVMDVRTPVISPSGLLLGYEGVLLDITRQSIAENQLTRNAWKENIATITKGLIHDFSNIMAGIFSISELYGDSLDPKHPWSEGIGQIKKSSKEAQQIVRRIIDLNRDTAGKREFHNLETLLREQTELIELILPKHVTVKLETEGIEIPVYLDAVRFRQMLLNLAINARDAFDDKGGKLTLSLCTIQPGEEFLDGQKTKTSGAVLKIEDDGSGIEEKHLTRIFAPFFTTKEAGKGSGFGLYNAKLFVEENEGKIHVASTLGKGTCFHIFIPQATFRELDTNEETGQSTKKRHKALVYAAKNTEQLDIVSELHALSCETILFNNQTELIRCLSTQTNIPQTLVFVDLGDESSLIELILIASKLQNNANIVLQTRAHVLDSMPEIVLSKIQLALDDSTPVNEQSPLLQKLLTSQ